MAISLSDERPPDLVAEILIDAISARRESESGREAALRLAWERGLAIGGDLHDASEWRPRRAERTLSGIREALERYGFEPSREPSGEIARNGQLEATHRAPDLVWQMTRALVDGVLVGLRDTRVAIVADLDRDGFCVRLRALSLVPDRRRRRRRLISGGGELARTISKVILRAQPSKAG